MAEPQQVTSESEACPDYWCDNGEIWEPCEAEICAEACQMTGLCEHPSHYKQKEE